MHRTHTPELEDAPWFPAWLRDDMTALLAELGRLIGAPETLAGLLAPVLQRHGLTRVVDLGSGAGGVMPSVLTHLRGEPGMSDATLLLTDLHPNQQAIAALTPTPGVSYERQPVDAMDLASAPSGARTMVNAFHHLRPDQALALMRSAQESRQPLLIWEMGNNRMPFWMWCLGLPIGLPLLSLMAIALVLKLPWSPRRLFFTFVVPLIPACFAWDGQASVPRIYTLEDLDTLIARLPESEGYRWTRGSAPTPRGPREGLYLLGEPT